MLSLEAMSTIRVVAVSAPILLLFAFTGIICLVALMLGGERRTFVLAWNKQITDMVTNLYGWHA